MSNAGRAIRLYATFTLLNVISALALPGVITADFGILWCFYTAGFSFAASYHSGLLRGIAMPALMLGVAAYFVPSAAFGLTAVASLVACAIGRIVARYYRSGAMPVGRTSRRSPASAAKELVTVVAPQRTTDINALSILEQFGYKVED